MMTEDEKEKLYFQIMQNLRYNQKRMAFFQFWENATKVISYIISSATVATFFAKDYQEKLIISNIIVVVLTAFDSFIKFGDKARDYRELYQKYKYLEIKFGKASLDEEFKRIEAELGYIELNEPPPLNVLLAICHNEEQAYRGKSSDEFVDISWFQRLCAYFFDWRSLSIIIRTEKCRKKKNIVQ